MKKLTVLLAIVLAYTTTSYGYLVSDYEWYSYNGHQYALTMEHSNWIDAGAEAIAVGGHLVTINNQAECDWLGDETANPFGLQYSRDNYGAWQYNLTWIGLAYVGGDKTLPSSWEWQNGDPVELWNPSPEAFYPEFIDGIHMYINGSAPGRTYPGQWAFDDVVDIHPSLYLRGVIEVVPEPCSLLLMALGGLLLRIRKA